MAALEVFAGSPSKLVAGGIFSLLLLLSCISDVRRRRIPNALVLALGLTGLLFSSAMGGVPSGVGRGVGGALAALAIWLPFYVLGAVGAGDVKLMAAVGAWLGPLSSVEASLLAAAAGGVLALFWLIAQRGPARAVREFFVWLMTVRFTRSLSPGVAAEPGSRLPYGLALSIGAALSGWFPGLIF